MALMNWPPLAYKRLEVSLLEPQDRAFMGEHRRKVRKSVIGKALEASWWLLIGLQCDACTELDFALCLGDLSTGAALIQ